MQNYPSAFKVPIGYCVKCGKPINGTGLIELCNCPKTKGKLDPNYAMLFTPPANAEKYPAYFKDVKALSHIDVYAVHQLFGINDPSGAIQHASKKLLLSGVRTGGKTAYDDVREARDTLNRYLEMHDAMVKKPV